MFYPGSNGISGFFYQFFQTLIYTAPAVLIAISMHEFAHGYVSYKLGDMTPKLDGRLTLNPFKHLDIWGTICLLFFHFGWAKPVRVNTRNYKNRRRDMILVAAAGPVMNFILAFIFMLFFGIFYKYGNGGLISGYLRVLCYYTAVLNVGLGVFNLIPLPPLDGSNILAELVPSVEQFFLKIRRYSFAILAILLWMGVLSYPLSMLNNTIVGSMWKAVQMILRIGIAVNTGGGGTVI